MGDDGKKMSGEGGIVKVEPKPSNGFTSKVVDLLEKLVVKFLYDSSLTHHYLTGNFAPVPETPPTKDLPVKGYLPGKIVVFCTNINYPGFWRAAAARQPQLWLRLSAISSNIEEGDETATLKLCFVVFLEIADKCSHNSGRKHPKNLDTMAEVMDCLNGEFVRVGPNPKFSPVAGYHCLSVLEKCVLKVEFDAYTMLSPTVFAGLMEMVNFTTQNRSSGICFSNFDLLNCRMIHGLRIKDGKATYVSRFVRTSRLKQEEYFGGSKFMKIGDLKGLFGLLMVNIHMLRTKWKVLDVSYGTGTANTALVYHHGKLLALSEADKPYAIKVFEDGDLQTLGMLDYDKRLGHSFTAHPKVDPFTGEAILK
ncbi:Carotenoid 9,10(9',10')-cleavage dioxygenase 1 [Glycine max]|nr:Carotenoid 9,10(9',10')-cleavage dioxygenase 1 [Glycine max]